ncbi:nucleoid-associated protein [Fusibacter bizertensis]
MQIKEAYLHVLDVISDVKLLSEKATEVDVEIEDYVAKHVEIFFDNLDISTIEFNSNSKVKLEGHSFKEISLQVADLFYDAMMYSEEIKPCDLMCISFEREERAYYGFLKLNFRTSFAHAVELEDNLIINKIIRQVTTLPYKSQKVEEGFLLDLEDQKVFVKDKLVTIDGSKSRYITEKILCLNDVMTTKRKIDLITKTAEKVIEKYDDQPLITTAQLRKMVTEELDETGTLDMKRIVDTCFDTEVAKDTYLKELDEKGVKPESLQMNEGQTKKLKRTQRLKTASGVEIILPFEYVSRSENLSIVNNPDGSVSIELKNLGALL